MALAIVSVLVSVLRTQNAAIRCETLRNRKATPLPHHAHRGGFVNPCNHSRLRPFATRCESLQNGA
jgi:hypothetical protein